VSNLDNLFQVDGDRPHLTGMQVKDAVGLPDILYQLES